MWAPDVLSPCARSLFFLLAGKDREALPALGSLVGVKVDSPNGSVIYEASTDVMSSSGLFG